jgi:hypothetical protein
LSKSKKLERQVTTVVSHPASESGDAERLAWGSTDEKVNLPCGVCFDLREVAMILNLRVMMGENSRGEFLNLRETCCAPAERFPRYGCGLDA